MPDPVIDTLLLPLIICWRSLKIKGHGYEKNEVLYKVNALS